MNTKTTIIFIFTFLVLFSTTNGQQKEYKKFFHTNGTISAEGYMQNGTPVGLWKSYYADGTIKTEGRRKKSQPDSTWKFYDRSGILTSSVSYKVGIRNGYSKEYKLLSDSTAEIYLVSQELYLDGKKNGKATYYKKNSKLDKTVQFKDGYKHGFEKFYNDQGRIITIVRYSYDNIVSSENINRTDKKGLKQGVWKTFFSHEQIKTFGSYLNDSLHGYFREYNAKGQVIKNEYYLRGIKQNISKNEIADNSVTAVPKSEYYENGALKSKGNYIEDVPIGIHRYYSKDGKLKKASVFDSTGIVTAEGKISKSGHRVGEWKLLYSSGSIKAKGNFAAGKKHGEWIYYYRNGTIEQTGSYKAGKPYGKWNWFYENKMIRRKGTFKNGKENGLFTEFSQEGDTVSNGSYLNARKNGDWVYNVNDNLLKGTYSYGLKEGQWQSFYSSGELSFEGGYLSGLPDGEHNFYYPNGKVKLKSYYFSGQKAKKWYKYDPYGLLISITEYKGGVKIKVNGFSLK